MPGVFWQWAWVSSFSCCLILSRPLTEQVCPSWHNLAVWLIWRYNNLTQMSMMLMWWYIANDSTSASTKTNCRFSRDVSQRFSSIGGLGRLSRKSKVIARVFANWTVLVLGEVLISMYRSSGVITFRFNSKTQRADVSVTFRRPWWCPSDTKLY